MKTFSPGGEIAMGALDVEVSVEMSLKVEARSCRIGTQMALVAIAHASRLLHVQVIEQFIIGVVQRQQLLVLLQQQILLLLNQIKFKKKIE